MSLGALYIYVIMSHTFKKIEYRTSHGLRTLHESKSESVSDKVIDTQGRCLVSTAYKHLNNASGVSIGELLGKWKPLSEWMISTFQAAICVDHTA